MRIGDRGRGGSSGRMVEVGWIRVYVLYYAREEGRWGVDMGIEIFDEFDLEIRRYIYPFF